MLFKKQLIPIISALKLQHIIWSTLIMFIQTFQWEFRELLIFGCSWDHGQLFETATELKGHHNLFIHLVYSLKIEYTWFFQEWNWFHDIYKYENTFLNLSLVTIAIRNFYLINHSFGVPSSKIILKLMIFFWSMSPSATGSSCHGLLK